MPSDAPTAKDELCRAIATSPAQRFTASRAFPAWGAPSGRQERRRDAGEKPVEQLGNCTPQELPPPPPLVLQEAEQRLYDSVLGATSERPLVMIGGHIFHAAAASTFFILTSHRQRKTNGPTVVYPLLWLLGRTAAEAVTATSGPPN